MGNVVSIGERGWWTAEELAEREGVSTRTVYNRLKRGEVEKRETEAGVRYRPFTEIHESPAENAVSPAESNAERITETPLQERFTEVHEGPFSALVAQLATEAAARGRLQAERDQLAAELAEWQALALAAVEEVERLRG